MPSIFLYSPTNRYPCIYFSLQTVKAYTIRILQCEHLHDMIDSYAIKQLICIFVVLIIIVTLKFDQSIEDQSRPWGPKLGTWVTMSNVVHLVKKSVSCDFSSKGSKVGHMVKNISSITRLSGKSGLSGLI